MITGDSIEGSKVARGAWYVGEDCLGGRNGWTGQIICLLNCERSVTSRTNCVVAKDGIPWVPFDKFFVS